MEEEINNELNRIRILNDIYKNENERLKYEYRILMDEFMQYKEQSTNKKTLKRYAKRLLNKIRMIKNEKIFRKKQ